MKSLLTRGAAAIGGLTLSLTAGMGIASADPIVDTTCSYDQVMSAANAQGPMAASFMSSPQQQAGLRQFLGASPGERQQIAAQIRNTPGNGALLPTIETVFSTCNNF